MKIVLAILALLLTSALFFIKDKRLDYQLPKGEQLVNVILAKTATAIEQKYDLMPCGMGVAMPGGPIRKLSLSFNTKIPYTKEQLRELLIKSSQELVAQVNGNNEIQEFLKVPPFSIKNAQIIIFNLEKDGRTAIDPKIGNAQILGGILDYCTIESEETFKYINVYKESYEEALEKVSFLTECVTT